MVLRVAKNLIELAQEHPRTSADLARLDVDNRGVIGLTGPGAVTDALRAHLRIDAQLGPAFILESLAGFDRPRRVGSVLLLPPPFFSPGQAHSRAGPFNGPQACVKHLCVLSSLLMAFVEHSRTALPAAGAMVEGFDRSSALLDLIRYCIVVFILYWPGRPDAERVELISESTGSSSSDSTTDSDRIDEGLALSIVPFAPHRARLSRSLRRIVHYEAQGVRTRMHW